MTADKSASSMANASTIERLLVACALMVVPGCSPKDAPEEPSAAEEAAVVPTSASVVEFPDSILVRRGACPFECCIYRSWIARTAIPVSSTERSLADTAFMLQPGDTFTAVTGNVHVTEVQQVIVTRPVDLFDGQDARQLVLNDTVVVLDYVGEGFFNVWFEGATYEAEPFWVLSEGNAEPSGEAVGTHATEWWVLARDRSGRTGWFLKSDAVLLDGTGQCG